MATDNTELTIVQTTALSVTQRAILALGITEEKKAELRELATRTVSITVITNADGYKQVHAGRMALKYERIELEKDGKAAREDATAYSKKVIELEKEAVGIISPEEKRLQELQDSYDAKLETEKQARIDAEIARVAAIDARIETIRNWPTQYAGKSSSLVEQQVRVATEYVIDDGFFEEKTILAQQVLEASRLALVGILAERQAHEAEQRRLEADREELAQLRAAQVRREADERIRRREEERKAEQARLASIKKPTDAELLGVLATHYTVPEKKVIDWILAMDLSRFAAHAEDADVPAPRRSRTRARSTGAQA